MGSIDPTKKMLDPEGGSVVGACATSLSTSRTNTCTLKSVDQEHMCLVLSIYSKHLCPLITLPNV